jgi:branched-chain amino acid aminotransferase
MFLGVTQGIDEIKQIAHALLERNTLLHKTAAIRITLTRGPGPRGLSIPENPRPTIIITGSEYTPPKSNFRCHISAIRRPQKDPLNHIKHLGYGANILAKELSRQLGFDECLMCNENGFLTSASAGNIFYSINQNWYTPPICDGALPGIMRSRILKENPNIKIASLNISEIKSIDGLFISNSLIGAHPVSMIEHKELKTEGCNYEQFRAYQCPAQ